MNLKVMLQNGGFFKTSDNQASGYDVGAIGFARIEDGKIGESRILEESECFTVYPHETVMVKTGVHIGFPQPIDKGDYYVLLEAHMRPRSGLSLKQHSNVKLGTIDNNYRGECNVIFINDGNEPLVISKYDRIGQIVFNEVVKFKEIEYTDSLDETNRGANGFGSTGK